MPACMGRLIIINGLSFRLQMKLCFCVDYDMVSLLELRLLTDYERLHQYPLLCLYLIADYPQIHLTGLKCTGWPWVCLTPNSDLTWGCNLSPALCYVGWVTAFWKNVTFGKWLGECHYYLTKDWRCFCFRCIRYFIKQFAAAGRGLYICNCWSSIKVVTHTPWQYAFLLVAHGWLM